MGYGVIKRKSINMLPSSGLPSPSKTAKVIVSLLEKKADEERPVREKAAVIDLANVKFIDGKYQTTPRRRLHPEQ